MRAIGRSKCRVFFLSSGSLKSEVWAQALISGRRQIETVVYNHAGPFIARISSSGFVWGVKELTPLGKEKKKPKRKSEQKVLRPPES